MSSICHNPICRGQHEELRKENVRYKTALEEISHRADYNGKFCDDQESCSGCVAHKALYREETARQRLIK